MESVLPFHLGTQAVKHFSPLSTPPGLQSPLEYMDQAAVGGWLKPLQYLKTMTGVP